MYFLKDKGCYYFPEIAPLYRTMRASDVDIDRFSFAFAGAKFDVVFAINRKPFELMFGCVGHGKCNFILTMEKGYMLSPISDEVFETLCRVLHLSYRGDRFTSYKFLQHVASKVPQKYSGHKIQPHEVAQVRNDIPDKEKIYFVRWYPHIRDNKKVFPRRTHPTSAKAPFSISFFTRGKTDRAFQVRPTHAESKSLAGKG